MNRQHPSINDIAKAEAELRRQHFDNETLRAGYAAARLEIESLQNKLKAVDAFGPSCVRALNTANGMGTADVRRALGMQA